MEERRIVTVLFCDVTGSTALASQVDAEDWAEIMSGAFPLLIDPVKRYDGYVARLLGDAVLAFFGAPTAHEDDPQRAILAALEILANIAAYRQRVREDYGLEFAVRIGINTGVAITGEFGAAGAAEYTAMGDAVNVAARMQQSAAPGTIQVTGETYRLARDYFDFEWLGPIEVKGKVEPVDAYRVIGKAMKPVRQRDVGAPLIGRKRELATLRVAINRLRSGQGGVLALVGEAGLGKSRLLHEARLASAPGGPDWIEDRLFSYEAAAPYGLVRRRICDGLGLPERPSPDQVREQVVAVLPELSSTDRERAIRAVGVLLGSTPDPVPDATLEPPGVGGDFRRDLTEIVRSLWESWVEASGAGVYVVDDFQHADLASLDVLELLFARTVELPLLVILVLRPEHQTAAWAFHQRMSRLRSLDYREMMLSPLGENEAGSLVDRLLSGMTVPGDFRAALIDRAGGNPLFAEEIVRSLIGRGLLLEHREEDGPALRLAPDADLSEVSIPPTLRSLMQERMDRLSRGARQTLQVAAVIGRTFRYEEIAAVIDAPGDLGQQLAELQRALLIRRVYDTSAREFGFNHALTWEAAYQIVLNRQRRRLHRQVAEAFERLYADQIAEHGAFGYSAVIAEHFAQGGDQARAAHWYRRAGSQAAAQFAHAEALRTLTLALQLTPEEQAPERAAIMLDRERIHHLLGQREEQGRDLAGVAALAEELDDDGLRCEVLLRRAVYADVTGDYQAAISTAQRVISLAEAAGDATVATAGYLTWGMALWHQGGYGAARAPLERALALARTSNLPAREADALRHLGIIAEADGDLAGARAAFQDALRMVRALGDRRGEGSALNSLGIVAYNQRAYADAHSYFDQSLAITRVIGDRLGQGKALYNLGITAYAQGDFTSARPWFEQALALTREIADREGEGAAMEGLGAVALYAGEFLPAEHYLNDALQLFITIGDQVGESETRANLSVLHHYLGDDATSREYAIEAVRIAREIGAWPSLVRALTCLGHCHLGRGDLELAEAAYQEAVELSQEQPSHSLAMEPLAGLARVSLARGAIDEARDRVEVVMAFLEQNTLDGAEDPILVYLTCYIALRDHDSQRALCVLRAGWMALQARANRAGDAARCRSLLQNVPSHRALSTEWKRLALES